MHEEENFNFNEEPQDLKSEMPKTEEEKTTPRKKRLNIKVDFLLLRQQATDFIKNNWLYIAIGFVAIIVAYYLIFGIIFAAPDNAKQQTSTTPTPPMQEISTPEASSQNNSAQPALHFKKDHRVKEAPSKLAPVSAGNTLMISQKDMTKLLNGFSQAVSSQVSDIEQSNSKMLRAMQQSLVEQNAKTQTQYGEYLKQLNQKMIDIDQKFSSYNQNLAHLSSVLSQTQTELKLLLAEKAEHLKKMTLRAVIPGRAWLVDGEGKTLSVTKGTQLDNYGTVTKIDSGAAKVYMSSGYVFS